MTCLKIPPIAQDSLRPINYVWTTCTDDMHESNFYYSCEELELLKLLEDCDHTIVHGVVAELSPVKKSTKSCKYFQAQLSNGTKSNCTKSIKVIAFNPSLHSFVDSSFKGWKAVKVTNCRVLKEQDRGDAHIFLNNHSQIANLPHKFHIPDHFYAASRLVQILAIKFFK